MLQFEYWRVMQRSVSQMQTDAILVVAAPAAFFNPPSSRRPRVSRATVSLRGIPLFMVGSPLVGAASPFLVREEQQNRPPLPGSGVRHAHVHRQLPGAVLLVLPDGDVLPFVDPGLSLLRVLVLVLAGLVGRIAVEPDGRG